MSIVVLLGIIVLSLAVFLIAVVMIVGVLKHLQREHFPNWKFLDYASVGYLDHLYKNISGAFDKPAAPVPIL